MPENQSSTDKRAFLVKTLEAKVKGVIKHVDRLQHEKKELSLRINVLSDTISKLKQEKVEQAQKMEHFKTAHFFQLGGEDAKEARKRVDRMVREIDQCITLMNM